MLLSLREKSFTYIGAKFSLRTRIQQHNSGNGSQSTKLFHLSPYAVIVYICGFNNYYYSMFHVERQWKINRYELQQIGFNNITVFVSGGYNIINTLSSVEFGIDSEELKLVTLFNAT